MAQGDPPENAPDPFFAVIHDGQWNACIGRQGDEQNYVDGYIEAALELVTSVIDKQLYGSRDTLAMPILYNGRHALELSLKFTINRLHYIGAIGDRHKPNHDILSHWKHLFEAQVGDEQIRALVAMLEAYVVSLAAIDDDGQELRYSKNRSGDKSLEKFSIVNLPHIRQSLMDMREVLTCLKNRVLDLEREHGSGSFTRECSRSDLVAIAGILGKHASWTDESFYSKKTDVRLRFSLSSRKFSKAVDMIKQSRELSALVGLESEMVYLRDEKIVFAMTQWILANPEKEVDPDDLGLDYFRRDSKDMQKSRQIMESLCEAIIQNLSVEEFAELEVLFYIGRDGVFGEHYCSKLDQTLKSHRLEKDRWMSVYNLMSKTNVLSSVVKGCRIAGRPTLAGQISGLRSGSAVG